MNEQQLTQLAMTITARSPFDLRNKLADRLGLGFTIDVHIWATLSRIAQVVWDAKKAN